MQSIFKSEVWEKKLNASQFGKNLTLDYRRLLCLLFDAEWEKIPKRKAEADHVIARNSKAVDSEEVMFSLYRSDNALITITAPKSTIQEQGSSHLKYVEKEESTRRRSYPNNSLKLFLNISLFPCVREIKHEAVANTEQLVARKWKSVMTILPGLKSQLLLYN